MKFRKNLSHSISKQDFSLLLARSSKTLLGFGAAGAVLLIAYSIMLPYKYQAVATVLPPERQGIGGMLSFLSNSPAYELLKGSGSDNPATDLFKTVIDSRSVAEEVAADPRVNAYLAKSTGHAKGTADTTIKWMADELRGSMVSEAMRTGMFTVSVTLAAPRFPRPSELDSTRQMAAYVANTFVHALDRFNRDRLMTSARNTRVFIEGEHAKRTVQLDSAYKRLQQFQEIHQAIALPEQLSATVSAAARLTGEIQKLEMALRIEERELGPGSPTIKILNDELEAAKSQLQKYDNGGAGEYILALNSVPQLTRELAGYLRETRVLEQVTAYLRSELEQQRISEQRDLPSLQLLDAAQPPTSRVGPGRSLYALLGTAIGLILGVCFVLMRSFVKDIRERPRAHYRLLNVIRTIRRGEEAVLLTPIDPQASAGGPDNGTRDASNAGVLVSPSPSAVGQKS
jgi:LPS O-antigen subunit length determinant protein (WzzB/FepE family)